MSWTNECTESNNFKVKNTEEVKEVLKLMGFDVYLDNGIYFVTSDEGTFFNEEAEVVLSIKPVNDKNLIGIISDYTNDSVDLDNLEEEYGIKQDEVTVTPITEYLQDQLLENEHVTITSAGFESRSSGSHSPFGDIIVITKNKVNFGSLYKLEQELLNS